MGSRRIGVLTAAALLAAAPTPRAAALPAGFPDLSGFAAVPAEHYFTNTPRTDVARTLDFSTPYNITCSFTREGDGKQSQYLRCTGRMADSADPCAFGEIYWEPSKSSYDRTREGSGCANTYSWAKPLSAGQKVSFLNVTCAVGNDRLVACLDSFNGEHGFVLQPSGSTLF